MRSLYHKVSEHKTDEGHPARDVQLSADPDKTDLNFNLRVGDPTAHDLSIWLSYKDLCDLLNAAEAYIDGDPDEQDG